MYEKIVTTAVFVVLFFIFVVFARILHHSRANDRIGESIDRATDENNRASESVKNAERTVDNIGKTAGELSELSGRSKEIVESIKKQRVKK